MKYIPKYLAYLLLLLPSLHLQAQEESAAVPFLNFPTDARTTGMGITGVALPGISSAIYKNAATALFSKEKINAGYTYTPWNRDIFSGSSLNNVYGYFRPNEKQAFAGGFRHFTHGEISVTDENGNATGTFKPKDWALDLGYSHRLNEHLALGLTLRYLRSDLGSFSGASAASAFAFDLSGYYQRTLCQDKPGSFWGIGLQVANIGSKVKYLSTGYDLPASIRLGGSAGYPFSEKHKLTGTLDIGYTEILSDTRSLEWGLGAEYAFLEHGFIRAGYHGGDKEKNSGNYATAGCGINFWLLRADFAYLLTPSDSPLKNTWQVSLNISIN